MTPAGRRDPASEWPLVGREDELAFLADARHEGVGAVVVGGAQGVGKSRLATEALEAARAEQWAVARVDGAAATASIPFAAVVHLAPPGAATAGDALGILVATTDHLRARASRRPLMVAVDDAHQLDEASLTLIRRLVGLPSVFVLLTVPSDEVVPAAVVGLWKDGHGKRLELQPLSRDETRRLLDAAGHEGDEPARWLWEHSLGNPLFLRELMMAGTLAVADAAEHAAEPGARLTSLVRNRLGQLGEDQRLVLEALAVAGPLPTGVVTALAPTSAVAALVARGLLAERHHGEDPLLTLAHPIYGVVLRSTVPTGHARAVRSRLLALLEETDDGSPRAAIRLAMLRLDQGVDLRARQLVVAARYAQAAFPQALAERLPALEPSTARLTTTLRAALPSAWPSAHDLAVATRLARAAWEAEKSLSTGLSFTTTLVALGRGDEADAVTAALPPLVRTGTERAQVALARASLQFWVLGQAEAAIVTLQAAEAVVDDLGARGRLQRLRAGIALNVGRVGEAQDLAGALIDASEQAPPLQTMAAATLAAADAIAGRPGAAATIVDHSLPVALAHAAEIPEALGQLMLARVFASRLLGRLDEAETVADACYQPAIEQGSLAGMAIFTAVLGQVALDRGQLTTAARRLREADVLLHEYDSFGYRPWVLASLATAEAQLGDVEAARAASRRARDVTTQPRYFDPELTLAEAWVQAADGRADEAARLAGEAADRARAAGAQSFEAWALHALVRFGRPAPAAGRLAAIAAAMDSPLVDLFSRHAVASGADDAAALDRVADALGELGALLVAAEAAAQASVAHDASGSPSAARKSAARSRSFTEACQGARTPALRLAARTPALTRREREVAALAARGLTSNAIAERLVLSPRTVESHLYRVFAKLGISDRSELPDHV